ncbi:MAG TPA: hypothetical protein VE010_17075 [Thermoanaerobaculia bacterium]|nr:hypothetical protein [Thermoanaerobaculia bacterium]
MIRRVWLALFAIAAMWTLAMVHRGAALAPDELEFFRATRWIGEGKVPFRDFWEHHTPLQWIVFAPVARLFAKGPGVDSVVALRWAQVALWIAMLVLLFRVARRERIDALPALVLLLVSATFIRKAVEYRLDVPGNLAYLGALVLIAFGATRARWIAFGALMSAAVLANMRLAPLVIATAIVALLWRADERRWRFNAAGLWMVPGVAAVAGAFVGWLMLSRAWTPFLASIIDYNVASATLLEVDTFSDALLLPLWTLDPAGIAFWLLGGAGLVLALRDIRTPGPLQLFAILTLASIATIATMEVQYDYHFQNAWLLMVPLVASALAPLREAWLRIVAIVAAAGVVIFMLQVVPAFGAEAEYQDTIMSEADRVTRQGETVFDGAGFALRREPAYRYWFLTTGVRILAERGTLARYDEREMAARPPAAIIADYRLRVYLQTFPWLARYATRHYVPLYRNLWVPGMTALVGPTAQRLVWIAPRAGRYDVQASAALATHPWFTNPLAYAEVVGPVAPRYEMRFAELPTLPPDALRWSVDNVVQPVGARTLELRKGSRVELLAAPAVRAGVLLVPHGRRALALAPADPFVF